MRILLANTGHPAAIKGGAEAAVLDLARAMARRGHSVSLVVHHAGRAVEESVEDEIRIHALPNRNVYFGFDGTKRSAPLRLAWHAIDGANPLMARAFGRILDREKPEVVNTHVVAGLSQLVWREAARRGLPVVHYLHEYGTACPRGSTFRDGKACDGPCLPCRALALPRKHLSRLVDTVVGVSRYTLERHVDWGFFPSARKKILPNIFEGLAFRGRKSVTDGPLRLGYFGRLIPDKGAHLVLEALRRLPPGGWTFDVAGTGDPAYLAALQAEAPRGVTFRGWTRADGFFPTIDILLVPSLWPDPQPRVVFEAYAHGVPVIGARAGGIPEQIDEGRTGWLFPAGDPDALAALLAARLADRADRALPPDGFRQRLDRLDPGHVAGAYETVFAEEMGRARGPVLSAATTRQPAA